MGSPAALSAAHAALVTLVAVNAVVHVPAHVIVLEVVGVVAAMAARTLENGVVAGINVARGAHAVGVAMGNGERRVLRVVERRACPSRGVVTGLTCCREELRLGRMAWIGRIVVIVLMATDARQWQRRVVAVDMAVRANTRRHHVRTRKRERCVVVIEC